MFVYRFLIISWLSDSQRPGISISADLGQGGFKWEARFFLKM
jgi:hypothetical protein